MQINSAWKLVVLAFLCLSLASCKPKEGHEPLPEALAALQSDGGVRYSHTAVAAWDNDSYCMFQPAAAPATTALILYGGANCDVRSYSPMAREIARAGYMVVLVEMPDDWALSAPERAGVVMAAFPEIDAWAMGGHSMGGIAACDFTLGHPDAVDAVVLWASWPSPPYALDQTGVKALSVSATLDGVYPPAKIEKSKAMLPADTVYAVIQGGNHQQFGWYTGDHQPFDGDAVISRDDQTAQIVAATVSFLDTL